MTSHATLHVAAYGVAPAVRSARVLRRPGALLAVLCLLLAGMADARAENGASSGLPLPRYVSLKTSPINMRAGPGIRYPIEWVYQRASLPVEVIAEFDTWRRIRDPEGIEGWVHQSMLSGARKGLIVGARRTLRASATLTAAPVAYLDPDVIVDIEHCPADKAFCEVSVSGITGWLPREYVTGIYLTETID